MHVLGRAVSLNDNIPQLVVTCELWRLLALSQRSRQKCFLGFPMNNIPYQIMKDNAGLFLSKIRKYH